MNDRELSRSSTGAFEDATSFFGAGGTASDGGYASSGAGGGREGSVTGGGGGFPQGGVGIDHFDDDDMGSDRSSLYSRSLSASSASRRTDITDPLDDFLKRYTIDVMPEETVAKLKKRVGSMVFGVNYCPQWDAHVTYTAKPAPGTAAPLWLHKLSYSPGSGAGKRRSFIKGGASSFSDDDDDGDLFVEPLEAAAAAGTTDASVSGSNVGGVAPPRPRSRTAPTFRALKSRLPPLQGVATLTSPKIDLLSWLKLQFVADADLATGRCGLRWRVSTKWSASPGRIGRKERWPIFDGAELKPRWSVDLYTPEVTGTFGAPQREIRGGRSAGERTGRCRRGGGAGAGTAGGSANGGGSVEGDAAALGGLGNSAATASSATDDDGSDDDDDGASAFSLPSSATSFRGRRRGARGRGQGHAALDLGHCHLRVPRLDAVVDADAAALSLVRAAKFVAVTPVRVLAGIPLAAARRAAGRVRKRALPLPPPPVPALPSPPPPARSGGDPFVAPGGLTFPPLPSFLSRSVLFPSTVAARKNNFPPQFAVRGWPWSLGLADGLESAAAWLRRATEEARGKSSGSGGGAASAAAGSA